VNTRAGRGSLDGFQSGIPISAVVHGAPRSRGIPLRRSGESKRYAEAGAMADEKAGLIRGCATMRRQGLGSPPQHGPLRGEDLLEAGFGQVDEGVQLAAGETSLLGSGLGLDESPSAVITTFMSTSAAESSS